MKILTTILTVYLLLGLAGCGGGGSSSGGGGTNNTTQHAGSYGGTYTLSVTGPGGTFNAAGPINIVISADGSVVIDPDTTTPGSGSMSGNKMSVKYPASIVNSEGISCTGTIEITGTASNGGFNGAIGPGGIRCNGTPISYSGSFTASKIAKLPTGGTKLGASLKESMTTIE